MSGGTRSFEMAKRLVKAGHEVHMVTSWRQETDKKSWFMTEEEGIKVHWLPVPYSNKMGFYQRIKAFVDFAIKSSLKAAKLKGDVVFATSTPLTIALPGIFASKFNKIPMVFEVRDLWPELPIAIGAIKNPVLKAMAKCLENVAYKCSSHVVALSPGMLEGVVKTGYPEKNVSMIPNSSDLELFKTTPKEIKAFRKQYEWLGERPLIIYCGALGQINGVEYLAKVAKEMLTINPEVRFLVVGQGKMEEFVRSEAKKLNVLNENFFMLPPLPKDKMPAVFGAATMSASTFIDLPEMWANSANKFFDTLASGTPVLLNYQGWQAKLMRETKAGIVVDTNNPKSAAQEINSRLNDPAWLTQASEAALNLAKTQFSRDLLAKKLEKALINATKND